MPRQGPLLIANNTGPFPAADLLVDAPGEEGGFDKVAAVFELLPASVDRRSGQVASEGGLFVRNLSRFVRGRRNQAALLVNGVRVLPQSEAVRLEPGDTLQLGPTGVTVEVAEAAEPLPDAVALAVARYLGGSGATSSGSGQQQQQQQPLTALQQQQQQQQQLSRAPSRGALPPEWDGSDAEDEGEEADAASAGRAPLDPRIAAAYSLARGGNPTAAERQLAALLAESPEESAAWFVWAQIAAGSRRPVLARDLYRAAAAAAKSALSLAEADPSTPLAELQPMSARLAKVLRVWARLEWDASLHGAARRLWRAAANEAFRYPRRLAADVGGGVLQSWASAELERDNLRNARTVIGEALRKCSSDAAVNVLAGSIVARGGDVEGARALFLRAYQLDRRGRGDKQLYLAWPALEADTGNTERARVLYQRGLALFPNSARLLNVYAAFEAAHGNTDLARSLLAHALSLDSRGASSMDSRASWAALELDAGDADAARRLLREGLDLNPSHARALVLMARLERTAGNLELANAYVRRAYKVRGP